MEANVTVVGGLVALLLFGGSVHAKDVTKDVTNDTIKDVAESAAKNVPQVTVKPLVSTRTTAIGQPITLPAKDAQVNVSIFEIPAGAQLPVHKHPFPRYAYVLAGTLRVSMGDGGRSFDYGPGDFIVEMLDTWHYGINTGAQTVRLLVIDQVEAGKPNTILRK